MNSASATTRASTRCGRCSATWDSLAGLVDEARFAHVKTLLTIQEQEARWWRDACLLYFQTFSRLPIPAEYEPPAEIARRLHEALTHYYVPGIAERRFDS